MNKYTLIATIYDRFRLDSFSLKMLPYIKRLMKLSTLRDLKLLDLACGTGSLAIMMAQESKSVTGVDFTPEMLKIARRKSHGLKYAPKFIRQDIRSLRLNQKFDLITCLFDSLNHITEYDDLVECFRNIRAHLAPGGHFIFDLNTSYGFRKSWDNLTVTHTAEKLYSIWSSLYDSQMRLAKINITVFQSSGNQMYKKAETDIYERAYTERQLQKAFYLSGLRLIKSRKCFKFKKPDGRSGRIVYICGAGT